MAKKSKKVTAVASQVDAIQRDFSVADPAFAAWLNEQGLNWYGGTDKGALALSAVYRACSIVAGTIATMPLKTYEKTDEGRIEVPSWISSKPAGPYDMSAFSWKEQIVLHLMMRGESFLVHVYNGAGAVIGALPVHPQAVSDVEWIGADKKFTIQLDTGDTQELTSDDMTHIVGLSLDGLRGASQIELFRNGISTATAMDKAANNQMSRGGGMLSGLVTPDSDIEEEDAKIIKAGLDKKMADSTGGWAVVNRALKFSPLQMTNEDAQFLQGRNFSVEDICRMFGGVPIHLMSVSGAVSNFGTGIAEQNAGLAKFSLMAFTSRIEEPLSDLLPEGQWAEFSYHGLLQGTPKQEIELLIQQVGAGLLTKDEARAILNLPPLPEGASTETPPTNTPPIEQPPAAQGGE